MAEESREVEGVFKDEQQPLPSEEGKPFCTTSMAVLFWSQGLI